MHHIHAKTTSSYDLVEPASFEASLAGPFTESDSMMCQRPWYVRIEGEGGLITATGTELD